MFAVADDVQILDPAVLIQVVQRVSPYTSHHHSKVSSTRLITAHALLRRESDLANAVQDHSARMRRCGEVVGHEMQNWTQQILVKPKQNKLI